MKIAIIGAGALGGALGRSWAKAGHTIIFGVRNPAGGKTQPPLAEIGASASSALVPDAVRSGEVVVLATPWPAEVVAAGGRPVAVDERGGVVGEPARFRPEPGDWQPVAAWAGPWPVEELWWEATPRRVARFQVVGVDGRAWLMTWDSGVWWTEAAYD